MVVRFILFQFPANTNGCSNPTLVRSQDCVGICSMDKTLSVFIFY